MTKFKTVAVSLTEDLRDRIQHAAAVETISVSAVVRRALSRYFLASDVTDRHFLVDSPARFRLPDSTAQSVDPAREPSDSYEVLMSGKNS